jgi:hypothetical protein
MCAEEINPNLIPIVTTRATDDPPGREIDARNKSGGIWIEEDFPLS